MTDETIEPLLAESRSGDEWQPIETAPTDRVIELGRFPNSVGANRVNFFFGDARLCNPEMTHWREHPTTATGGVTSPDYVMVPRSNWLADVSYILANNAAEGDGKARAMLDEINALHAATDQII